MSPDRPAWLVLPFRLLAFALCQASIAIFVGWNASAAWWPVAAVFANVMTIGLLVVLMRAEGRSYGDLFAFRRDKVRADLLWMLPVLLLTLPLAYVPNVALATWLFGDPELALNLLLRPLPAWAALLAIAFPLTIVFAELPLYFGYAMPRIAQRTGRVWLALSVTAFFLAAQHVTLPLLIDWRFALWRLLMFLPFALFLALVVRLRPSLLGYLVVVHGALDFAVVAMLLQLSL